MVVTDITVIFASVQPFSTTLFGVPCPRPSTTTQGRRDSQLMPMPKCKIRVLRKDTEANSASLVGNEY